MTAAANGRGRPFWRVVRAALAGRTHDLTEERLGRAILLLAVPMVIEMLMESIFVVVDIFWVSHRGADAVAIVGLTESMMAVLYAVALGLGMAATAVVARRIGEKDPDGAARAAVQVLGLAAAVAVALGAAGAILAPRLLAALGGDPAAIEQHGDFARVMLGGSVTVFLLFAANAVFRGAGDPAIAMRTLWLANAVNLALGPCLLFGWGPFPELGVAGAAVATTVGRGAGVLYQLAHLVRRSGHLAIRRRHLAIEPAVLAGLVRVGAVGVGQMLVGTVSWIGMARLLAPFGSAALAGYVVAMRVIMFAVLPASGLALAASTLVGQSLGAGQPGRAEDAVWTVARWNLAFLGGVALVLALAAGPIVRLFPGDPAMHALGATAIRVIACGLPMNAYAMVLCCAFNGAGDTWTPTLLNLAAFCGVQIPLAWILARPAGLGAEGVLTAVPVGFAVLAALAVIQFRRGGWKAHRV